MQRLGHGIMNDRRNFQGVFEGSLKIPDNFDLNSKTTGNKEHFRGKSVHISSDGIFIFYQAFICDRRAIKVLARAEKY